MTARVTSVERVEEHPDADLLTINHVDGKVVISNRLEDGSPRYAAGHPVVLVQVGSILPEWLMQRIGYWDDEKGQGLLDGNRRNRVKARKMRGLETQGILFPVSLDGNVLTIPGEQGDQQVTMGQDVTDLLGITEHQT